MIQHPLILQDSGKICLMNTKNRPIGVFDSGIGGLTVVKEIVKTLPHESIIYLGDTARVPYGPRGRKIITKFALEMADFLLKKKVKFLVVACNTISATCLNKIREISPVPVLGVVEPTVKLAASQTKTGVIGVIGTRATVTSGVYERLIKKQKNSVSVLSQSCSLFVPLAEEGLAAHRVAEILARDYLKILRGSKADILVLGCTHYPLLSQVIGRVMGKKVKLIDSAKPVAEALKAELLRNNLLGSSKPLYRFWVTDDPKRAEKAARSFFGRSLPAKLRRVNLSEGG